MVRESKHLSYDTEGTGVDWKVNKNTGYVIGAPDKPFGKITEADVVYVPVRHGGGGNLLGCRPMSSPTEGHEPHPWETELARAFDDRNRTMPDGKIIGHHMKFDVHMSANEKIMLGRNLSCTQDREAMLDEYAKKFSLDASAERRKVTAKKGQDLYDHLAGLFGGKPTRDQMGNYWRLSGTDPLGYEYAVGDGVTTYELWCEQQKLIEDEELEYIDWLEGSLIWTVFRMERKGIRVDTNEIANLRRATEQRLSSLFATLPDGFNVRSPLQMKELMESNGHTDWPTTAKGNPSFTEKWLKTNSVGKTIIEIRQATNLINSFVEPLENTHMFNGRVHATLNQLKSDDKGTISGRFSCNAPNLQQVPKRVKELAVPFRRLFIPDEGYVFWERDYSQCEPRLFAHYSQDPNLLKGYNAVPFVDAHQVVADLLNVERDPTAKRMNMGIFTGMQTRTFAAHMNWPLDKAADAWHLWFRRFPKVKNFQDKAKARLKTRGYVKTLLGRRGRLEAPRFAYRGASKVIQGSNADIVKLKLLEADRMCEDNGDIVQILMTVHDSFNGQFEETPQARKLFGEMVDHMAEVQCEPYNLTVPFLLEGEEGRNWAEATFGSID